MSADYNCRWRARRPSAADVRYTLQNYLNGCGYVVAPTDGDDTYLIVKLPGLPSHPFRHAGQSHSGYPRDERSFEVYYTEQQLNVVTREADELTNVLAAGFARLVCRYWEGRWDDGGHTTLEGGAPPRG